MSKKNKNDSLFEAINGSELATLSGGKKNSEDNITGKGGSVGHTIDEGSVTRGKYESGSSGQIHNGK